MNWEVEVIRKKEDLIRDTQEFLRINSVMDETTAGPGKPFGEGVNASLTSLLELEKKKALQQKILTASQVILNGGRAMTLSAYFAMLTSCRREMGGRVIHFQLKSATDGFMQGAPLMTKARQWRHSTR